MSYDISLVATDTNKPLKMPTKHTEGGTYQIGGTDLAELNITYNYATIFGKVVGEKGIRTIYGMTGRDSLPILQNAIGQLKDDVDDDYWKPTEGNARKALIQLAIFALHHPEGIWKGD